MVGVVPSCAALIRLLGTIPAAQTEQGDSGLRVRTHASLSHASEEVDGRVQRFRGAESC